MSEIFGSLRHSLEFFGKTRKADPKRSKIAEIIFCVVYIIFHVSFSADSCINLCIYLFPLQPLTCSGKSHGGQPANRSNTSKCRAGNNTKPGQGSG